MKTKSRMLAIVMALIMIVGMLPISAFAEGEATPSAGEAPAQTQETTATTPEPTTPEPKATSGGRLRGSAPWSGAGTEKDPWRISSADDLVALREFVLSGENTTQGKYFKQTADISLSAYCGADVGDWTPIGVYVKTNFLEEDKISKQAFNGVYDGGGYKISDLYIANGGSGTGLFGEVNRDGTIKNLTVAGSVSGDVTLGGIVGYLRQGSLVNCHFNGTVSGKGKYTDVGGIAGKAVEGTSITACSAEGDISGVLRVGGIVGGLYGNLTNCHFNGTVSGETRVGGIAGTGGLKSSITGCNAEGDISGVERIGGIAGSADVNLTNCHFNKGTVTGTELVGGIAGHAYTLIENCKNYGKISGTFRRVGGITGESFGPIKGCENHGAISGPDFVGGITAHNYPIDYPYEEPTRVVIVENCKNYGNVTADNDYVGGIVAQAKHPIIGCENHGTIKGNSVVGGIAGNAYAAVDECTNYGKVTGKSYVGDLLGHIDTGIADYHAIAFYPNGGKGEVFTKRFHTSLLLGLGGEVPDTPFSHGVYTFFAWNTKADGSGDWYRPGEIISFRHMTLYAIWVNKSESIAYYEADGESWKSVYARLPRDGVGLGDGWYFVRGTVTLGERLMISGDVNLILLRGATLNAQKGINVPEGSSLTIWEGAFGSGDIGRLNAHGADHCAGIGGGVKSAHGGTVIINGRVIINTVGGKYGAGIGGGDGGDGGKVIVNAGTIIARGFEGAAGIGGGDYGNGGDFTINGGIVTATGSKRDTTGQASAGVGAGRPKQDGSAPRKGGSVTINGGTLIAETRGDDAHAIGVNKADASHAGTVVFKDGMRVMPEGWTTPATDRTEGCRQRKVTISACEDHFFDGGVHCRYCQTTVQTTIENLFDGEGTYLSPFQIKNEDDWNLLAYLINECRAKPEGHLGVQGFRHMAFALENDITVSTMIGVEDNPFFGTFYGGGHTLTMNYSATADYAAPFRYVSNSSYSTSIMNLHVAGSISTNAKHAAGIVGRVSGSCNINGCRSSVAIDSWAEGDGTHGGLVATMTSGSNLSISGCVFDGSVTGAATTHCGGLVGYGRGTLTIKNSMVDPSSFQPGNSQNFARMAADTSFTLSNSYYKKPLSTQGLQARSVTAGEGVTVDYGESSDTYSVSDITVYAKGLKYGDTFYAGSGEEINLTLDHDESPEGMRFIGYDVSAGTMTGNANPYTLTMPADNVEVKAIYEDIPVVSHTVTYKVVGGTWADGSTTPKTEEVEDGKTPTQIPTGMKPAENYEGGAWNPNPNGATITDTASFTYTFTAKQPQPTTKHTVTYIVVNGTWADGTTKPKTEEVEHGQSPAQIPTGMLPAENYEGGSWNPNPNGATITDTASFTYTFTAKQNPPQPTTKHTVTYIVVNGTWADGTTTPKTEEVEHGKTPAQIPTGMLPAENYEGGSWSPDPNGATITDAASFTYTFTAKQPPQPTTKHTVTYIVVNGTWADGTTTPKTEEVEDGQSPAQIPSGMIAAENYEGGAWNPNPNGATITDAASFTYTFTAKQPPQPTTKHTVTYIVVNGTWSDGTTTPKTEDVENGQSPAQIPSGMIASEGFEGGSWNPDPSGATITDTASFTYTFKAKQNPPTPVTKHTVTYIVVNGTWADGTKTNKTEEVEDGQSPAQIPTGMIASEGFEGGSWSPDPSGATITDTASFTYTFTAKQPQPTTKHTVTYIVVNGTWADGTTTPKTEEVKDGQSPAQIPTGMIASEGFEGGSWSPDPSGATINDTASFTYTFKAKQNPPQPTTKHTVTYIVVNGTWADGTNGPKTEEVEDGQSPSQIPTGMIASEGFEGGAWSPDPTSATITDTASFTYTFTAKQPQPTTISYAAKDGSGNTIQSVTWQKGSGKNLDLTFHRSKDDHLTYGLFGSLEIGGVTVGSANYGAAEGSLKLCVKPEYLETLSVGDHTVKVNFQDGSATVKLTVKAAAENPKTGDESIPALWSSLMFLSVAAMVVLLLYARKRKTEK